MIRRAEAKAARSDTRIWVQDRRARTRHLIELGGLVQKAGLVDLTRDDRAVILGALLSLSDQLLGEGAGELEALWRRRGQRVFDSDQEP